MKLVSSFLGGIVVYLTTWLLTQLVASQLHAVSSNLAMFLMIDGVILMQVIGFTLAGFSAGRVAGHHGLLIGFALALVILGIFHFALFLSVSSDQHSPLHIPAISILCCTMAAGLGEFRAWRAQQS